MRCLEITCRKAEGELDTAVAPLHDALSQIQQSVAKMAANQERILVENCSLKAHVPLLTTEVAYLRSGLLSSNTRLTAMQDGNDRIRYHFRTPPAPDKVVSISTAAVEPPLLMGIEEQLFENEFEVVDADESLKPTAAN